MKVSTGKIHTIMKTKNIFLTAISALFIFAACTEEKIMDEPGVSGKGDLVIELSPSSVITKAAAEDKGYVYATEEELNVEDCWIFVFGEDKKYITSQYFSGDALSETENEYVDTPAPNGGSQTYKKGYTITLTGLDYGTYDFWVVANPTEANEAYKSCQSLDALKEIIEGGDSYQTAFAEKANQLVKVGNKSATFNLTTVASPIQIPLTQLAARVELKVRVDIPRQLKGGEYVYEGFPNANGVLTNAEIDKLTGSHIRNEDVINSDLQRKDGNDNYLYTYFGHPVTISVGFLMIPVFLIVAAILPGNTTLPLGELPFAAFYVCFATIVHRANKRRTIISSLIFIPIVLWISSWAAPLFTQLASNAGLELVADGQQATTMALGNLFILIPTLLAQIPVLGAIILIVIDVLVIFGGKKLEKYYAKKDAEFEEEIGTESA